MKSKVGKKNKQVEMVKISKGALCFSSGTEHVALKEGEVSSTKIQMTLYSGKVIPDHWYWGDLVIDTSGIQMAKKKIPILQDHNTDKKIGFGSFGVNENQELISLENDFVDTPFAEEFKKLSAQGFPYEASLYGQPVKIQRLGEKEEAEVNGFIMKGPGTIWRESVLKEGSIVTFGYDPKTKSAAMAENEEFSMEIDEKIKQIKEEVTIMNLEKFKAEHPELFAEVVAIGTTQAEAAFVATKTSFESQIADLTKERDSLKKTNTETSDQILKLEKRLDLQEEKAIKTLADGIVLDKLMGSKVPERLFAKVKKQINHESFVKDNVLDSIAFSAAIDAELKDWIPTETETDTSILGMSFGKEVNDSSSADDIVNRMLKTVGQTVQ